MRLWYDNFQNAYDAFSFFGSPDETIWQALPEDLKTKLSLDEDLVSSPKEALSRASASRVAMRNKNLRRWISCSSSLLVFHGLLSWRLN